jgi:AraC-like DNA-binding protein
MGGGESMKQFPTLLETPRLTSIIRFDNKEPLSKRSHHQHEDTEFIFIEEGQAEFTTGNQVYPVSAGEILLLNSYIEHGTADSSITGYSVMFTSFLLSELPPGHVVLANDTPVLNVKEHNLMMSRYLEDLYQEYDQGSPGSNEIAASLLNAVLLKIIRFKYVSNPDQVLSISEKAKRFIEQNYHIDLSLNDLANHIFVSPYHLSHTFKSDVGVSPISYLIQYRIEISKKMLKTSSLTIAEIAYRVGYPNSNYFNLIFKKIAGVSPGKYRKQ